jgi:hypothetical protein
MRNETIECLYRLLEARVLARRGNRTDHDYLEALGAGLPALRQQYYSSNVVIDYAGAETIDRYLLAYYPHYVFTASEALSGIPCATLLAALARGLDVVCVGGGPLPELIALVDRILECGGQTGTINLTTIDLNAATWAIAVQDTLAIANALAPKLAIRIFAQQRDCTEPCHELQAPVPPCDILVIQNCLNEIGSAEHFHAHALQFTEAVRRDGYFLISDLTEYGAVSGGVPAFEDFLAQNGYQAISRFNPGADAVVSPFALNVPNRTYFAFFGFSRDTNTGERRFPEWRRPRKWVKFSTAAWQRM